MKIAAHLIFICVFICITTGQVSAHAEGGSSLIEVNGESPTTNPLFQELSTKNGLVIPQDLSNSVAVINTPITIDIDASKLEMTSENTAEPDLRVTLRRGSNFAEKVGESLYGSEITTTLQQAGSYLITVETKQPGKEYTLVDTILLHVVPTPTYRLPRATVRIESAHMSGKNTTFSIIDPQKENTYLWDLNENAIQEKITVNKTFAQEYFYTPVIARVITKDGFISDTGILVIGEKGVLTFSLLDPKGDKSSLTITKAMRPSLPILGLGILIAGTIMILLWLVLNKRKNKIG